MSALERIATCGIVPVVVIDDWHDAPALAMTTPGDTSTARLDEVRRLVHRPSARIVR